MITKKYLIIGHPRCGTGYMAKLFQAYGYDVGHEYVGEDGTSNWMWTMKTPIGFYPWGDQDRENYYFENTFVAIRNPIKAVWSIMYTENIARQSVLYRMEGIPEIQKHTRLDFAVASYLEWYKYIFMKYPKATKIKIEEASRELPKFVKPKVKKIILPQKNYNSRKKLYEEKTREEILKEIKNKKLKKRLLDFEEYFNY